jgi:hypothetical protein
MEEKKILVLCRGMIAGPCIEFLLCCEYNTVTVRELAMFIMLFFCPTFVLLIKFSPLCAQLALLFQPQPDSSADGPE